MFASKEEATKAQWFSRRHETSDAYNEARRKREARHSAKLSDAHERAEESAKRTPEEQLRRLDLRLGVGVGAEKERARLHALAG